LRKLETELKDRVLRFDGVSIVHPDSVASALARGLRPSDLRVTELTEEVQLFNDNVVGADQLFVVGPEPINIPMVWQLPDSYKNLDVQERVFDEFFKRLPSLKYTPEQEDIAVRRLADEVTEVETRGMMDFMRTIVYVLDTFRTKNIVWGVGRGSSCACYVLFVLGLHVVDCVRYEVPMNEFFHD
jgi:Bacterial DNA polymerase III alpha NTPase domain